MLRWLLKGVAGMLVLAVMLTASLRWCNPTTSAFMLAARLRATLAHDREFTIVQRWMPVAALSPWAGVAVIAAEDQNFRRHHGFDLAAVRAAVAARQHGAALRGASTLSQQLAKNLFLWSGRSWLRKACEAWFTLWIEILLDKQRILELYLNVVEFGPGVYGVEAASQRFFGHGAATLSADEAAALAAVLPSPRRYSVTSPSLYVQARRRWILAQMRQLGGRAVMDDLLR